MTTPKTIIGHAEKIDFPTLGLRKVPAKVDTGADSSAIWASHLAEEKDGLHVIFFGKDSEFYTGEEIIIKPRNYTYTRVSSSFGHKEVRFKIKLTVKIKGRTIISDFTLADRKQRIYPILIGRSLLRGEFVVDVTKGSPLRLKEREHKLEMIEELALLGKEVRG